MNHPHNSGCRQLAVLCILVVSVAVVVSALVVFT